MASCTAVDRLKLIDLEMLKSVHLIHVSINLDLIVILTQLTQWQEEMMLEVSALVNEVTLLTLIHLLPLLRMLPVKM